jgi:molybdopterin-guanine dinucleotide biosynthesis protein MobB
VAEQTRIISVVGKKNTGKTTMVVALAQEWTRRGKRVATLKHGTHPATVDTEGTDTWRHFHEGGAESVLIEAPTTRVLFERIRDEPDPIALARRFMIGADIVIAEGFTASYLPKIEVFRSSEHKTPRYDASLPNAKSWVAIVTDGQHFDVPFPLFRFNDTALLVTLSALAWDAAYVIDG